MLRSWLPPAARPARCVGALLLLAGLAVLPAAAQPGAVDSTARARLAAAVADTIEAAPFAGAWWGLHIRNLETGETLYSRNPDQRFVPASNTKLLTAAAALERLGPDYRYTTTVYADGPIRDSTLQGNLIVRGRGDPTLGGYRQRRDPTQVLRRWADSLRAHGIRRVEGDVIGTDDPFSDAPMGPSWNWDWVPAAYAAEPNGLVFNGNTIDLQVVGRRPGTSARVRWAPLNTGFVRVQNATRTVPRDSATEGDVERALGTNDLRVATTVHPDERDTTAVTITDPTQYTARVVHDVLLDQGLSIAGTARAADALSIEPDFDAETMRPVATYRSPPLRAVVHTMNHESHNLYAEQLLRTMAVVDPPPPADDDQDVGSAARGVLAVRTALADVGVDTSAVTLEGGSGLSRKNLVTPRALTQLLTHYRTAADTTTAGPFRRSLPTGGSEGTLEDRYPEGAPARGRVRAKTGTLTGVSALSGYVEMRDGTPVAFSILCNHHRTESDRVRAAQDAIVNAIVTLPSGP
jgi:D-alanyl-D-alanine carboxypeptidase/D-alanyl-D-alanine-endopeptidase (penicillin-binding protein 4)